MKLWTYWRYVFHHKVFSVSFVIDEKKTTLMKRLSIYFGHCSLAFLNSFLNILNKYNVLILNKYNPEQVIYFIHEFVLAIYRGTEDRRDGSRGLCVEEHKHPFLRTSANDCFSITFFQFCCKCENIIFDVVCWMSGHLWKNNTKMKKTYEKNRKIAHKRSKLIFNTFPSRHMTSYRCWNDVVCLLGFLLRKIYSNGARS